MRIQELRPLLHQPKAWLPRQESTEQTVVGDRVTLMPTRPTTLFKSCPPPPPPPAPPKASPLPWNLPKVLAEVPDVPVGTGFNAGNMDISVDPSQDFFRHAMGTFLKNHPIPEAYSSWGIDAELSQRVRHQLKTILEESAASQAAPGTLDQKIGDFYASANNLEAIEKAGLDPVQPILNDISAIQDKSELGAAVADLHARGLSALFDFGAGADAQDASRVIAQAFQGGLTLPNRDYYFASDDAGVKLLGELKDHVARTFELTGQPPERAADKAAAVLRVETALAQGSLAPEELRDPAALYNVKNREALHTLTPNFDWAAYLSERGRDDLESINVGTPAFFEQLNARLGELPLEDLKAYLSWQVLNQTSDYLPQAYADESFRFDRLLSGAQTQAPRWERAVRWTDDYLGEALGQKFVERHFTPEAKAQAQEMVGDVLAALREKIGKAEWMGDDTKVQALAKLDGMNYKIGYPDVWTDYSALEVRKAPLATNVLAAKAFAESRELASIGQPVDRTRWQMTPATVNAYYDPTMNEFVFPAAILQPPYFDAAADDAMNYGATGATIGHEITHGFDDEGAQFDAQGNLRDWWTDADRERFQARARGVEEQFSSFSFEGIPVNGKLVLGESLADLGGLEVAYSAYHRKLEREGVRTDVPGPDGFTPDQRFFLAYAQSWGTNMRPEKAKALLANDPHPLPEFRVNGPLANMPAFAQAFKIPVGSPMARPEGERNRLWD